MLKGTDKLNYLAWTVGSYFSFLKITKYYSEIPKCQIKIQVNLAFCNYHLKVCHCGKRLCAKGQGARVLSKKDQGLEG